MIVLTYNKCGNLQVLYLQFTRVKYEYVSVLVRSRNVCFGGKTIAAYSVMIHTVTGLWQVL